MPQIRVLPKHVAELIAAGEVVERPSSVVKELMENAVDAGATSITLEIRHGGITYIRITDNGCGIAREDVPTAFISHATSKLRDENDLHAIGTLGFRGEALASIAAVSKVEILTRAQGAEIGTRCCVEGGEQTLLDDAGCPEGTTLLVRDLFYNTPARMKFLKKDVSEANAVAGVVDRIALSHPEISVRFIRDGKETLLTPGDSKLLSAIYAVFGRDFAQGLLPVDYRLDGIHVSGYLAKPLAARPNRSMQFFYVNGRLVRTGTAMSALEQAYKNSIMVGKFPACVLHLEVPAQTVDVNVHPAKIEVRFAQEKKIFEAVYYAAKNTLEQDTSRPQAEIPSPQRAVFSAPQPAAPEQLELPRKRADFWQTVPHTGKSSKAGRVADAGGPVYQRAEDTASHTFADTLGRQPLRQPFSAETAQEAAAPDQPSRSSEPTKTEAALLPDETPAQPNQEPKASAPAALGKQGPPDFHVLGEAFDTYIFVEAEEKLLIIDKHAAHERMLFDQLRAWEEDAQAQMLLAPVPVTLTKEEYAAVLDHLDVLRQGGFEVEDFGAGTVLVRACPLRLTDEDVPALVMELAGHFLTNRQELLPDKLDWLYHSVACRAAVKAGRETPRYEMEQFVGRLLSDDSIRYCPHGRPVLVEMTRRALEKQFGRIS